VPDWVLNNALRARQGKTMKGKATTEDISLDGRKLLSWFEIRAIRRSGDRGTSLLNYMMNLIVWITVMSKDAPKILLNPATRWHTSRLTGKKVWTNFGFEGDDSLLTTTDVLKPYEDRIMSDWQSLGFHMKLKFVTGGGYVTFVGYTALCDEHGPREDILMPELLRNIASSAWTSSHQAATRDGRNQVGAESYAARACNFLETAKPIGNLFRAYAMGHYSQGAKLTTSNRDVQMVHTGEFVEGTVFNLGEMMQDADDGSLWNHSTEEDFLKLINLQCGGIADLIDLSTLCSIGTELDPDETNAARFFLPVAWRTDQDVIECALDSIPFNPDGADPV